MKDERGTFETEWAWWQKTRDDVPSGLLERPTPDNPLLKGASGASYPMQMHLRPGGRLKIEVDVSDPRPGEEVRFGLIARSEWGMYWAMGSVVMDLGSLSLETSGKKILLLDEDDTAVFWHTYANTDRPFLVVLISGVCLTLTPCMLSDGTILRIAPRLGVPIFDRGLEG